VIRIGRLNAIYKIGHFVEYVNNHKNKIMINNQRKPINCMKILFFQGSIGMGNGKENLN